MRCTGKAHDKYTIINGEMRAPNIERHKTKIIQISHALSIYMTNLYSMCHIKAQCFYALVMTV